MLGWLPHILFFAGSLAVVLPHVQNTVTYTKHLHLQMIYKERVFQVCFSISGSTYFYSYQKGDGIWSSI